MLGRHAGNWKKPERRRKTLIRLGVDKDHAYTFSRTRMGGWRVTKSNLNNYNYIKTVGKEKVRISARLLFESISTT